MLVLGHAYWANVSPRGPLIHISPELIRRKQVCDIWFWKEGSARERLSRDGRFRSDSMSNLRLQGHAWSGFASSSSSSSSLLTFSRLALNNVIGFVKVNLEIEANIQVTREIESDIVKCSEIESSLSVKESDLTRSFLASQYELTGLISVTGLLRLNSLWILSWISD